LELRAARISGRAAFFVQTANPADSAPFLVHDPLLPRVPGQAQSPDGQKELGIAPTGEKTASRDAPGAIAETLLMLLHIAEYGAVLDSLPDCQL
jgi:hypothetical protein